MEEVSSLYIHIPFCISKCKYCDFFSIPCGNKNKIIPDSYIQALCNEILFRLKSNNVTALDTIYIGGGTPSLLTKNQLVLIFKTINSIANVSDNNDCEITIEANPDDITEDLIGVWKNIGINRISLGIQSFDDGALSYVSRRASASVNKKALEIIRGQWSGDLSVDLICGLPVQSANSFKKDLDFLLPLKPHHISMYSLTIEDETPLGIEYNKGMLNYDFDFADELWLSSKETLKNNGYEHYEVSNFCLKNHECKHNLKYWNHQGYIGVGSGGAGTVYFSDGSGLRWSNIRNIEKYTNYWLDKNNNFDLWNENKIANIEQISIDVSKFEYFMMGLRKLKGISSAHYKNIFGENIPEKVLNTFYKWEKEGLCQINKTQNNTYFGLGHKGIIYLNKFLEELL